MRLEVRIGLPPIGCSPNVGRCHWGPESKARRQQRMECAYRATRAKQATGFPCLRRARIHVVFFMGKRDLLPSTAFYRPRDRQNAIASIKGAVDGLVDARVLIDDDHRVLEWGEVQLKRTAKEHGGEAGVLLVIEAMEGGTDAVAEN